MFNVGPNGIAVALAVFGIGLALFGFGRRSVNALSLIGATLGLAGASWLAIQAMRGGGPVLSERPPWWISSEPLVLSPAAAFFLAFQSLITVLCCGWEFRARDERSTSTRLWVAVPVAIAAAALLQDRFAFAAVFLTANVAVTSISGGERSSFRLFKTIGALVFVAAVLFGVAKTPVMVDGRPNGWADVAKNCPQYLLGASLVISLMSRPEGHGGPAQRMSVVAAPFLLMGLLTVQIGLAPFGGRLATILTLIAGAVAAWHGWRAFRESSSPARVESIAAMFSVLGVYQWINSTSMNAVLACFAALTGAALFVATLSESGREFSWTVWSLLAVAGIGTAATLARVLGEAFERATASSTSLTGAAIWLSIAFMLAALALCVTSLKNVIDEAQSGTVHPNSGWITRAAVLSLVALFAGAAAVSPAMFGELPSPRNGIVDVFGSRSPSAPPTPDLFAIAIGLMLSLLAVGVGIALPHRATATAALDRNWYFAPLIAAPFALCERITEGLLTRIYAIFSSRDDGAERRAPNPAGIILAAAVAGAAVLVTIHRNGGAAP